ncbi:hypothetical protein ACFOSC_30060 [Streptantibioticus rubrisoli]|uniref:Uncharacterized protein n=1 Tax=Streptantibioticus rubrisoli TaxID=1387313 RepID=A0ABT1P7P5_9ACTN|nr:hypothetical protein [Streptantibioticus rubrisoli]MCQ4041387.1 hypothetical protein [Streptantibioticus rubrisoli]
MAEVARAYLFRVTQTFATGDVQAVGGGAVLVGRVTARGGLGQRRWPGDQLTKTANRRG